MRSITCARAIGGRARCADYALLVAAALSRALGRASWGRRISGRFHTRTAAEPGVVVQVHAAHRLGSHRDDDLDERCVLQRIHGVGAEAGARRLRAAVCLHCVFGSSSFSFVAIWENIAGKHYLWWIAKILLHRLELNLFVRQNSVPISFHVGAQFIQKSIIGRLGSLLGLL